MTKKDYEFIAKFFSNSKPILDPERLAQWITMTWYMADILEMYNPRFNRIKFLKACDYPLSTGV